MEKIVKTNYFTLDNGIRVAIVPIRGLKSVTVEVFLKIGSKYELSNEFGMSHFLEHMAFKGTKKRPTGRIINQEIDNKGAFHNASTEHEITSYYITTINENIPWAVEMLSDMLINSVYDKNEVLKERGVIMQEIRMFNDDPMTSISGETLKFMYGKSKIGCWDIAGEISDIESVNREKIVNFRSKFINPKEMVVVLAGNVDLNSLSEVKKYFGDFNNDIATGLPKVDIILNKDKLKVINKKVEQDHFVMAVPAIKRGDERRYAFKLLNLILNGNSSSRLFQKIREDKALAYYVDSVGETFEETGFWGVQSGVTKGKLDEAVEIIRSELMNIGNDLAESELSRAKDCLTGTTKLLMDRSTYWSTFYGRKLLLEGGTETMEEELIKYQKTSLIELKELAKDIFIEKEIRLITIKNI